MDIIVSQTNYTLEEASELLEKHNGDYMTVIRNYLGVPPPKQKPIVSVNQEIYRMLRKQVDITEYNNKQVI
jgi:hypothetical protein